MKEIGISPKKVMVTQITGADDYWQREFAREMGEVLTDEYYRDYIPELDGNSNEFDRYSREDRFWPLENVDEVRNPSIWEK